MAAVATGSVLAVGVTASPTNACESPPAAALQESGLARVLLPELGLETIMRINRPAKPGDTLQASVGFVDVPKGVYKLDEADFFTVASLSGGNGAASEAGSNASSQTADEAEEVAESADRQALKETAEAIDVEAPEHASMHSSTG